MHEKVNLTRTLPQYRARVGRFDIVDIPEMRYLAIDGHGDPNTAAEFASATAALFPLAYTLKFLSKQELQRDYTVPPLEGLWWADHMDSFTAARDKSQWHWTLLMCVPDWLTTEHVDAARDRARTKRPTERIGEVRLLSLAEGRCAQTLHVGSFDEEAPVLEHMHARVIPDAGYRMRGLHHEIYLSDQRRVAPEKMRTILRQPIEAV